MHVRPAGVEADTVNETVPVKPLTAPMATVEVPVEPANIWTGVTPPVIVKSTTTNVIVAVV